MINKNIYSFILTLKNTKTTQFYMRVFPNGWKNPEKIHVPLLTMVIPGVEGGSSNIFPLYVS